MGQGQNRTIITKKSSRRFGMMFVWRSLQTLVHQKRDIFFFDQYQTAR